MEYTLIFPHQLFKEHPAVQEGRTIVLVEEWLFFHQYRFHQQKIVLHRASMQYYKTMLEEQGYKVLYIEAFSGHAEVRKLVHWLAGKNAKKIFYADVVDDWLRRRLLAACKKNGLAAEESISPAFLNSMQEANAYFNDRKTYFQTDFYIAERKKRGILVAAGKHPEGGKWSFDADNRKKFPKTEQAPVISFPKQNEFVQEACAYVAKHFAHHYGDAPGNTFYPTTHKEAGHWLQTFLEERLQHFGVYEDAMVARESFLYHGVLSPLLNVGLLEPADVLKKTLHYAAANKIPLSSLEGFVRQIMGWREFIRIVYEREGRRQRTVNHWGFTRKIPRAFWQGQTGIAPLDIVINRLLHHAYTHHIERLMVLGNFMLLCEFAPDEVYRWFMEMYIDAYDWVMVPNTYGMTQFADGGIMMTKPYISSSNYIKKMSDFKKGEWETVWDALFWRFMAVHREQLEQNPRIGMLMQTWDKMPAGKRRQHLDIATAFLQKLDEL